MPESYKRSKKGGKKTDSKTFAAGVFKIYKKAKGGKNHPKPLEITKGAGLMIQYKFHKISPEEHKNKYPVKAEMKH
jgi:hypothetical protein